MMVIAERDAFLKREILSQQVRGGFLHPASLTCLVSSRVATIAKTRGATVVPRGKPKWVGALCSYEHSAPRNVPTRDSSDRSNKMTSWRLAICVDSRPTLNTPPRTGVHGRKLLGRIQKSLGRHCTVTHCGIRLGSFISKET